MNPFLLSAAERLADWRQFRATLSTLTEPAQFAAVAAYWAKAPLSIISEVERWPSIWQMLYTNIWSRNTVAVGMEATLRLLPLATERLTLCLLRTDPSSLLVLNIDDRWLLNYDWGSFRSYCADDFLIIRRWRFIGKDYFIIDG